jgi:hypothetical protein
MSESGKKVSPAHIARTRRLAKSFCLQVKKSLTLRGGGVGGGILTGVFNGCDKYYISRREEYEKDDPDSACAGIDFWIPGWMCELHSRRRKVADGNCADHR